MFVCCRLAAWKAMDSPLLHQWLEGWGGVGSETMCRATASRGHIHSWVIFICSRNNPLLSLATTKKKTMDLVCHVSVSWGGCVPIWCMSRVMSCGHLHVLVLPLSSDYNPSLELCWTYTLPLPKLLVMHLCPLHGESPMCYVGKPLRFGIIGIHSS